MNPTAGSRRATRDTRLAAAFAGALAAALCSTTLPVFAVDDGGTSATIVIAASGSVSVTAPDDTTPINLASVNYGDGSGTVTWPGSQSDIATLLTALATASDAAGQLGEMTVVDSRLGVITGWTATVDWTTFEIPGATLATEIIDESQLRYSSGAATTTGLGTLTPQLTPVADGGTAATYVGALQVSGTDTVKWNPTIYIDLQDEVAGTYSGTITHSVTAS